MKHVIYKIMFIISLVCISYRDLLSFDKLTIMTQPLGVYSVCAHQGVTTSLLEGLRKLNVNFNYNPSRLCDVGDVVCVLADPKALQQAIELKRNGHIKKLLAGPNIITRANEHNHLIASPEVDVCIVPCAWVQVSYVEDEPSLQGRIKQWYAGLNADYWNPELRDKSKTNTVLVYWKTESENFCSQVEQILRLHGWNPIRVRYGHYGKEHYRQLLNKVAFSVFISCSESQGLALAESWAMNVPTMVWDLQEPVTIRGKPHWPISSAPYLTKDTGMAWKNIDEFEQLIKNIKDGLQEFKPRQWVLENMTDEISARLFLKIIDDVQV